MKIRLRIVFLVIIGLYAGVLSRAFYLQVLPNERLDSWRERQFNSSIKISSRRPSIVDINGKELALSIESYSLYADPQLIQNRHQVARALSPILKETRTSISNKLRAPDRRFVWLKRFMTKEERDQVLAKRIYGINFIQEYKRIYPNESLLGFALGRVGGEGHGLSGVEFVLDRLVPQNEKLQRVPRDAKGRPLVVSDKLVKEMLSDKELQLTIDNDIQHYFERRVRQVRAEQEAVAAFAIVLDLQGFEIRAMAYDSTRPDEMRFLKNPLVSNVYEFGSVLKPISIGAALEQKVIDPKLVVNVEGGTLKIGRRRIREAHYDKRWNDLNLTQLIARSSNVGTAKIAFKLGDQLLFDAYKRFNLTEKTGINLPGESRGILANPPWSDHRLSNIAFGQGMAITPMQLLTAYGALASDGFVRSPVLLKKVRDVVTGEEELFKSQILSKGFSGETLKEVTKWMTAVTQRGGTGERAGILGYQVAGKTGTAQKALENGRGYKPKGYLSTFAGFFPAEQPRFVMLVAVDEPQVDYYGSQVAAPLFSELGTYLVRRYGIKPSQPGEWQDILTLRARNPARKVATQSEDAEGAEMQPDMDSIQGVPLAEALSALRQYRVPVRVRGQGEIVQRVEAQLNAQTDEPELLTVIVQ